MRVVLIEDEDEEEGEDEEESHRMKTERCSANEAPSNTLRLGKEEEVVMELHTPT